MKKLVTLSAIAMVGATLGVGTTFGWWADDSGDDDKSKPAPKVTEKAPDKEPPGVVYDGIFQVSGEQIQNVNGFEFKLPEGVTAPEHLKILDGYKIQGIPAFTVSGDEFEVRKVETKPVLKEFRVVQKEPAAAGELEKLAQTLEQEAKELEDHGQKEPAEIQRKLAGRLRERLKALRPQPKEQPVAVEGKVKIYKNPPAKTSEQPSIEDLKKKLVELQAELKRRESGDAAPSIDVIIAHAKAHAAEAHAKAAAQARVAEAQAKLQHMHKAKEAQYELAFAAQAHADQLQRAVKELHEVAEQLEKEGKKEQAHAVHHQAEQIQNSIKKGLDHKPVPEVKLKGDDVRGLVTIHLDENGESKGDGKPRILHREIHVKSDRPGEGAPLGEIHGMLKSLQHEIKALREEVRDLRASLGNAKGSEVRFRKTKVREEAKDDDDDDEDEDGDDEDEDEDDEDMDEGVEHKVIRKGAEGAIELGIRSLSRKKGEDRKVEESREKRKPGKSEEDREEDDDEGDDDEDEKGEERKDKAEEQSSAAQKFFNFYVGFAR